MRNPVLRIDKQFGDAIVQARTQAGLTQSALAGLLGMGSRLYMHELEHGIIREKHLPFIEALRQRFPELREKKAEAKPRPKLNFISAEVKVETAQRTVDRTAWLSHVSKADACVQLSRLLLPKASSETIEDLSVSFMALGHPEDWLEIYQEAQARLRGPKS